MQRFPYLLVIGDREMENFPDVHVPHQCLPVHINSSEECLKSSESVRSGSSFSSLKKEFIVPTTDFNATIKPYALSLLMVIFQDTNK
jgi:hypothetical protein